jgi:hypothetical protein
VKFIRTLSKCRYTHSKAETRSTFGVSSILFYMEQLEMKEYFYL